MITISREADGWYACFSCVEVPTQPLPLTGQETGIDLGLEAFATLANGNRIANPRHHRKAEKRLAKAQRRVSPPQDGEPSKAQGGEAPRRGTSEGAPSASGFPTQGGAGVGAPVRHHLPRRLADGQHAQESPPCQVHRGRWLERIPQHPRFQGSVRREAGRSRAACLHQPDLFWLRRAGPEGLVRPLALLPGLRDEPVSGPQQRQEHPMGRAGSSGSRGAGRGVEPSIPRLKVGECQAE